MLDVDHLKKWIGRTEVATDMASAAPLTGLAALLDHDVPPWPTGEVPPLGHWLSFLPRTRQSELAEDGHPRRGGFLPPVPLPRRMWAGGRLSFESPIAVGAIMERRSTIADVSAKSGKSGTMVFVTVTHEISVSGRLAIREEQDIVYREASAAPASRQPATDPGSREPSPAREPTTARSAITRPESAAPRPSEWVREVTPDAVQLFRYSALTFNAHRIHYDRAYCYNVEGYPGLVVQGPFIATLLMDHFLRRSSASSNGSRRVTQFRFRAQRPLYDTSPFSLCLAATSAGTDLWTVDAEGQVSMEATVA